MSKSLKEENLIITDFILNKFIPMLKHILENGNPLGVTNELISGMENNINLVMVMDDINANELLLNFIVNVGEPTIQDILKAEPFTKYYIDIHELLMHTKKTLNNNVILHWYQ